MLDSVGYIGYGFVGKACHEAFKHNASAIIVDPKYSTTTIKDLIREQPRLTFVSINAPTLENGKVDASVIYNIFRELADFTHKGIVVLKSTLTPDIVEDLNQEFGKKIRYVYSPEFLREAHWAQDAVTPPMVIMAGDFADCKELEEIYDNHSHIKLTRFVMLDYKEAALVKYTINSYLAAKVVFMNQIYQLYTDMYSAVPMAISWDEFTEVLSLDSRVGASHLKVPGNGGTFGYGGSCFPKDVKALLEFDKNKRLSVLAEAEQANTKLRIS
jgi:UDPglucose 6-dehydrogenase